MKIAIFGAGYVGLVTGVCFADLGNDVVCVDIDPKKIEALNQGKVTIYEVGLEELLQKGLKEKRLIFTIDAKKAIQEAEVIFICVGTPPRHNGEADLTFVTEVAKTVAEHMNGYKVIINKSTVPVGTADYVKRVIQANQKTKHSFDIVSNPEFLREGAAVKDFQNPDRVIVGTDSDRAKEIVAKLYKPVSRVGKPIVFTSVKSSELIKYASNAMLATRISFMNELSFLCEEVGADIKEVAHGMGLDTRIGPRFLQAGAGYGGSCFPKDVKALAQTMERFGFTTELLRAVDYINDRQKKSLLPKLKKFVPKLDGKKIAVWGLAFKPRTDDIREATSITVIEQLQSEYANVVAYDPEATENAKKMLKDVKFVNNQYDCLKDADALIIVTEWDQFREPDFEKMKKLMKGDIIIDGRNIYEPEDMKKLGFRYIGVGRG